MIECDILIAGCGPAGASLAYYLSVNEENKIKVIFIDKKKIIENPVRCAEFVSTNIVNLFDFKIAGINNLIDYMDIYTWKQSRPEIAETVSSPGFMLDRAKFVDDIAERFKKNGGIVISDAKISNLAENNANTFVNVSDTNTDFNNKYIISTILDKKNNTNITIKSKIVVGADGPTSFIGRYMGSKNEKFLLGMNENIGFKSGQPNHIKIFFTPFLKCGYGWIFPKSESINMGIGFETGKDAKEAYTQFKDYIKEFIPEQYLINKKNPDFKIDGHVINKHDTGNHYADINTDKYDTGNYSAANYDKVGYNNSKHDANSSNYYPVSYAAGLIPVSGIVKKPVSGNFVLIGDAAGLSHPITGAGIYNAVSSSRLTAPFILKALKNNDLNILNGINAAYENEFGRSLNFALSKRSYLTKHWPKQITNQMTSNSNDIHKSCSNSEKKSNGDFFLNLIKKTWPTFKEYWK